MSLLAGNLDVSAGLLDEAVDHAQPEARPLADVLRGEERLEDLEEMLGGDPGPGVADEDLDERAR